MPTIPVNLSNVEAYENLPLGEYLGQIDKITYKAPREAGKFGQLMVTYTVIDGDQLGRASNEWLSLSPKAAFRLKKWFAKFGLDNTEDLVVGDPDAEGEAEDGDELSEPDLIGVQVIFSVHTDKPRPGETEPSIRTSLVSVEDDVAAEVAGAPAPEEPAQEAPKAVAAPVRQARPAAAARAPRRTLR
jgi:hypothetical protein